MSFALYTDENVQLELVEWLRNRGIDVVRCQEIADPGEADYNHLQIAVRLDRVLITRDMDFVTLSNRWVSEGREHPGIIYTQPAHRDNTGYIAAQVIEWQDTFSAEQMRNVIWWI